MAPTEQPTELAEVHPGRFLRSYRTQAGLSLRAVAQRVGCNPSTLSRVENELRKPTPDLVTAVAHAIGELLAEKRAA